MFEPGKSGNPKGKPRGAISEKRQVWNEIGEWFRGEGLEAYKDKVMGLLESEKPSEVDKGLKHFQAMINYFAPRLQSTELKAEKDTKVTVVYESEPIQTSSESAEDSRAGKEI